MKKEEFLKTKNYAGRTTILITNWSLGIMMISDWSFGSMAISDFFGGE